MMSYILKISICWRTSRLCAPDHSACDLCVKHPELQLKTARIEIHNEHNKNSLWHKTSITPSSTPTSMRLRRSSPLLHTQFPTPPPSPRNTASSTRLSRQWHATRTLSCRPSPIIQAAYDRAQTISERAGLDGREMDLLLHHYICPGNDMVLHIHS